MLFSPNNNRHILKIKPVAAFLYMIIYFVFSCTQKHPARNIERSFYYWKSIFKLTDFEKKTLDSLQVKKIYLKFFDVTWDNERNEAIPKAQVRIVDTGYLQLNNIKIIPVVFITNECIQKSDAASMSILAGKIAALIQNIQTASLSFQHISEVQIDCDWSAATKERYFLLLTSLKKAGFTNLSATIRLHQIKFASATGIPPVAKGLLMCYNMGNLKDPATKNSIIETAELKKYTSNLWAYPLLLDAGLPLFDWYVLFRKNNYTGLVKSIDISNPAISILNRDKYIFIKDTMLSGIEFKKEDILRREESDYKEVLSAATFISSKLNNPAPSVALFHLDSVTLKKYSAHELENIYNSLH
jgi:hypothetical protein